MRYTRGVIRAICRECPEAPTRRLDSLRAQREAALRHDFRRPAVRPASRKNLARDQQDDRHLLEARRIRAGSAILLTADVRASVEFSAANSPWIPRAQATGTLWQRLRQECGQNPNSLQQDATFHCAVVGEIAGSVMCSFALGMGPSPPHRAFLDRRLWDGT